MPIVSSVLIELIKNKVNDNMASFGKYPGPMAQKNPSYFMSMCQGIGQGIADGTKSVNFVTKDKGMAGLPFVGAAGTGIGIDVDAVLMDQVIYSGLRDLSIADFGSTSHDPFPPRPTNSGNYLRSLSKGIADAIKEHYKVAVTLNSTHTTVYFGKGDVILGAFYGLSADSIKGLILAASPSLQGAFWPKIADTIAKAYVDGIHNHSSGLVLINGTCIPSSSQSCGTPFVGVGNGVAS